LGVCFRGIVLSNIGVYSAVFLWTVGDYMDMCDNSLELSVGSEGMDNIDN